MHCDVQDAVKLYCLCKLPHDGERPMLQCDSCRDWFHWDCVGLTPPGDDEDDEEVAPADFQCPSCCLKVHTFTPSVLGHAVRALRSPGSCLLAAQAASVHTRKDARSLHDLRAVVVNAVGWLLSG